jgi:hypothetical protein
MPTQTVLATAQAGADGALPATEVTLPGPLEPGTYDLVVRGDVSAPRIALATIEVAAASPSPAAAPGGDNGGWPWWLLVILVVLLAAGAAVVIARRRVVLARRRRRAGT